MLGLSDASSNLAASPCIPAQADMMMASDLLVGCGQVMMKMSPSGSKRHRVKRMSTFSGQPISGMDQDGMALQLTLSV